MLFRLPPPYRMPNRGVTFKLNNVEIHINDPYTFRPENFGTSVSMSDIDVMYCDVTIVSQSVYFQITWPVVAIFEGKKIAHFYTISETQAARNLYFQYVNYQ